MAGASVKDLATRTDKAWANLTRQLQGMEPHLERSDAPGEWTTRQVLSHLLFEPGWDPVATLGKFAERELSLVEIVPGDPCLTDERKKMTLGQLVDGLRAQRERIFGYLVGLPETDLEQRKARIPLFKQFMGTDEISIAVYVGAMFDFHWNDHAGQLAKIRNAAGLPAAG